MFESNDTRIQNCCASCGTLTSNQRFCSRKCSNSFNNLSENGRKTGRKTEACYCKSCSLEMKKSQRRMICDDCRSKGIMKNNKGKWTLIENLTKQEVMSNSIQPYDRIRHHARKIAKENGLLNSCEKCGYSNHVECAHRIPIEDFPLDAKILEINSVSNLSGLCPNHHWEHDHQKERAALSN